MSNVRRATKRDLGAILSVDARAFSGDAHRIAYLTQAVDHDAVLVATTGAAVQGFAVLKRQHFYAHDFIDLLVVAEEARRLGLGRDLMRAAVTTSSTRKVFTSTNKSNAPMRELLQTEGWELSGELDGLDEGDPELVYFIRR